MIAVGRHYALASLPALDPPGAPPPLPLTRLLERVPLGRPRALVAAVLTDDDLRQREAWLAGELKVPDPAVLELAELRGDVALPGTPPVDDGRTVERLPADAVQEAWVRHVAALARSLRSDFLAAWIATEVGLRNRLAVVRARALRMDPDAYRVAPDLERVGAEEEAAVRAWSEAPDPLAGLQALLMARWRWVRRREPWFSFRDDEFAAYAVELVLLHRWQRSRGGARGARR